MLVQSSKRARRNQKTTGWSALTLSLERCWKHAEEKKVIRNSQHIFTKGKSRLTNLIAFYDGAVAWVGKGRALGVVYLDLSKALDTIYHKLRKCWVR